MKRRLVSILSLVCLLLASLSFAVSATATSAPNALIVPIKGGIGPATASFVELGFKEAEREKARVIILEIDTPGGLSKSMRDIIQYILKSNIPVVAYVAPSGAHAASAGTYILYASHIAAMAPGTNLGAATPVAVGGTPEPASSDKKTKIEKPDASKQKALNDARAYIRSLAQMRKRNVQWAESAVTKADSLSATEALKKNVINLIANNTSDLLQKINGQRVEVGDRVVTLQTQNLNIKSVEPNWRIKFLSVITDPSVAYILLMIGFYGLFFEFVNPGFVLPGVVGAICLIVGLYALQLLPVNYAGLILIILGLAFVVSEAFVPSFGALGLGGGIAFVLGSILLFRDLPQGYGLPWTVMLPVVLFTAVFAISIIGFAWRSRQRPIVTGREALIGKEGIVEASNGITLVRISGERWQCKCNSSIAVGDRVKVTRVDGLTLWVEKT